MNLFTFSKRHHGNHKYLSKGEICQPATANQIKGNGVYRCIILLVVVCGVINFTEFKIWKIKFIFSKRENKYVES